MKAQTLYDFVEKYGFCSGTDLHGFFRAEVGDPSPVYPTGAWGDGDGLPTIVAVYPYIPRVRGVTGNAVFL